MTPSALPQKKTPRSGLKVEVTRVVNVKARGGYDVFIGRPSKWGNPFKIGKDGTREEVIAKYAEWARMQPDLVGALDELIGMRLGCFCSPLDCHGDVLVELANLRELHHL